MTRREIWSLTFAACALLCAFTLIWLAAPARAEETFTPDDVVSAIHDVSADTGVSETTLTRIVGCETGGTFNPYSVGRQGELGPVQLHPRGELLRFRSWGLDDPFNPWLAVGFLATRIQQGGARAWSCR